MAIAAERAIPPAKRCKSPRTYKRLRPGKHRVVVRAVDPSGKVSKPARKRFRVKRR